ncbi:XrtA/PEP-CTERM system histidine kinase PrsK [Rubrivivax gelatinosus]|uniref:histidine kinase n=1 Tax=Rubrivivax gelatinosus TaxID=28068 RepID=A0A4R2MDZ4_RUBGE|nr:XrtA/PEP-CTERM system histidine kinase PrsK [Rubrivivax gelatinosus]MBK1686134.1 histidine kinase [Rubrivivax gelatinosus]TCP05629.1 putative PEP-CTERM system histidine kinase [Rubrivivax gelatinosus]
MERPEAGLALLGFALAALVHAGFVALLVRAQESAQERSPHRGLFLAALLATVAWGLASAWQTGAPTVAGGYLAALADLLRLGLWLAFMLALLEPGLGSEPDPALRPLRTAAGVALIVALCGVVGFGLAREAGSMLRLVFAGWLLIAIVGLVLVEQLFRNLPEDSRWNAKPVCLGLGLLFAFDLYVYAEGVLFGRPDPDALAVRGFVVALAMPWLLVAARRRRDWIRRLQVSRSAAFYSATLILVGAYLLVMAGVGYWVRDFGGDWGRGLQIVLAAAGVLGLALLVLSGAARSRLRVFVGKHFFSYRYDYREEWLRFTAMLSSRGSPQEIGGLVVRGLANMVESPSGSLWLRGGADGAYRQSARWNTAEVDAAEAADSALAAFLAEPGWVVDLDEFRDAPRRYGSLALPAWLQPGGDTWLVVPLPVAGELLGFVTLGRPRTPQELNWEVRDLLKTAARQAAGILAQMQATEALLEARKFEAFNRMSAFVVHDLKNIVTQLSLMMKNAQRLHANPEFQQDMLMTVESSLEKMRRLMLQLREGATPPGGSRGVELAAVVGRIASGARSAGRHVETDCAAGLATRGHEDRLERVLGHLVQNALDATPAEGRVWVRCSRHGGQVKLEIGDTGCGMSEDFIRNKLFRPFSSTKTSGMGIGSYESFQYLRELGGSVDVDSRVGEGTVITLLMPLFEPHASSDLRMSA